MRDEVRLSDLKQAVREHEAEAALSGSIGMARVNKKPRPPKRLLPRNQSTPAPASTEHLDYGAPGPAGSQLIPAPPDELKMSEVLGEFIWPWLWHGMDMTQQRNLLDLAIVAWNAAIESEAKRDKWITQSLSKLLPAEMSRMDRANARQLVMEMIDRKLADFASIRRLIYSHKLTDLGNGQRHLSVTSTFPID